MNKAEPCTDIYRLCTANVQTRIYQINSYSYMLMYILVKKLYTQCIYQVHILNVQVHVSMHKDYKSNKLASNGFEPKSLIKCADA
jgi:hypothetical protein